VFSLRVCWERSIVAAGAVDARRYRVEAARRSHPFSRDFPGGTLVLKRVVAIFDGTQKVRKSPGTLAGDGDLGHLEGMTAWGRGRRFRDVRDESSLPPTPEGLGHPSEPTLRGTKSLAR
jgi:hypothetical protein